MQKLCEGIDKLQTTNKSEKIEAINLMASAGENGLESCINSQRKKLMDSVAGINEAKQAVETFLSQQKFLKQ